MDRRLTTEEIDWLRKIRDARGSRQPAPEAPLDVVRKLSTLGCVVLTAGGRYSITLRGRDELIDRELERTIS
jgi:hypothetical protein